MLVVDLQSARWQGSKIRTRHDKGFGLLATCEQTKHTVCHMAKRNPSLPYNHLAEIAGWFFICRKRTGANIANQARSRLGIQLERNKRLFVFGDLSEREYLVERKRIQSELAAIPVAKSEMPDLERGALLLESLGICGNVRGVAKNTLCVLDAKDVLSASAECVDKSRR